MSTSDQKSTTKMVLGVAALGALVTGVILTLMVIRVSAQHVSANGSLVHGFEHPKGAVQTMLATSDGQVVAALARDPSLSHREVFNGGAAEFAYRAMRPMPAYLAWLLSGGQRGWVPGALIAVVILGGGAIAAVGAVLFVRHGVPARFGLVAALLPGALSSLHGLVPEAGGVALVTGGWILAKQRRLWLGVLLLSLGGLWRETLLVVPAVLVLTTLWETRAARAAAPYLVPFAVFAGWVAFVREQAGAWPWSTSVGRLAAPFVGIVKDISYWKNTAALEILAIVVTAAVIVLAVRRRDELAPLMVGYGVLGTVMGQVVWHTWADWCRVLLPLHLMGLVVLVRARYVVRDTARAG